VLGNVSDAISSSDGSSVLTIRDNVVQAWRSTSWQSLTELRGHQGTVYDVAFSPCGKFVTTASADQTARVWNVGDGAMVREFRGHESLVGTVDFSPDGKFLLTTGDGTARVWQVATGKSIAILRRPYPLTQAAFSPDGKLIITTSHNAPLAQLWKVPTWRPTRKLQGVVGSAAFSRDSLFLVTASHDGTGRIWDVRSGKCLAELKGPVGEMNTVDFSPDGTYVVTVNSDNTARVWEARQRKTLLELREQGPVYCASFSPNGNFIITGSTVARIWDRRSGRPVTKLYGYSGRVYSASFSPDGKLVVISSGTTAQIYSAEICASLDELLILARHRNDLTGRRLTLEERQSLLHETKTNDIHP
jgi:WD40 repeat protein